MAAAHNHFDEPFVADCQVRDAAEVFAHKWDIVVLAALRDGPTRRRQLKLDIGGVSDKVLTESLSRLTDRCLVERRRLPGAPPQAIYALAPAGVSFTAGPLQALADWALTNPR